MGNKNVFNKNGFFILYFLITKIWNDELNWEKNLKNIIYVINNCSISSQQWDKDGFFCLESVQGYAYSAQIIISNQKH